MKLHTRCGRTLHVTRFTPQGLPTRMSRVVLDTSFASYDEDELWTSLTSEEARRLAGLLLLQAAAVESEPRAMPGVVEALSVAGDAYAIRVRGHVLPVDQPLTEGGTDTAPTPVKLFVAAVAGCAAHYAGRTRPPLPAEKQAALRAVVPHCTVTNTFAQTPEVVLAGHSAFSGEADRDTETTRR
ncbi:OsmC family protein [Streptomyces violaceorubidus]|uniref:OsmC family peroxiredoxin n=1 Tax=Streptomyces violaceorubidus TaxID=284042 RepID=A0ABV1SN60_9ACTN